MLFFFFFFFKQKTAYEIRLSLVGSEMCIRDRNTEESDLYLPKKQMKKVLDGDEVLVRISGKNQRSRKEAIIIEVLEHRTKSVVCLLYTSDAADE